MALRPTALLGVMDESNERMGIGFVNEDIWLMKERL
jgi:hypothetical protein